MSSPSLPKHIFVFRHAHTDWNSEGRYQGHIDTPLSRQGQVQVAAWTRDFKAMPIQVILSSDLARAHDTAAPIARTLGIPHIVLPELREVNLGQAQGHLVDELDRQFGPSALKRWNSVDPAFDEMRFPGGESKVEAEQRLVRCLLDFLRRTHYQHLALCSHGFLMARLARVAQPGFELKFDLANHSPVTLQILFSQGKLTLRN